MEEQLVIGKCGCLSAGGGTIVDGQVLMVECWWKSNC